MGGHTHSGSWGEVEECQFSSTDKFDNVNHVNSYPFDLKLMNDMEGRVWMHLSVEDCAIGMFSGISRIQYWSTTAWSDCEKPTTCAGNLYKSIVVIYKSLELL